VFAALLEYAGVNYMYWGRRAKKKSGKDQQQCSGAGSVAPDALELSPIPSIRNRHGRCDLDDAAAKFPPSFRISRPSYGGLRFRGTALSSASSGSGPGSGHRSHNHAARPKVLHALRRGASALRSIPRVRDVNLIDKYSRVIFPMSFLFFNLGYWVFYVLLGR